MEITPSSSMTFINISKQRIKDAQNLGSNSKENETKTSYYDLLGLSTAALHLNYICRLATIITSNIHFIIW